MVDLMFKENLLEGKRILVTGGGTGLGKEMSRYFLKFGAIERNFFCKTYWIYQAS